MTFAEIKDQFYNRTEVVIHVVVLILYFLFMELGLGDSVRESFDMYKVRNLFISVVIVFYVNAFWLIPKYLKEKRWVAYIFLVFLLTQVLDSIRTLITVSFFVDEYIGDSFIYTFANVYLDNDSISGGAFLGILLSSGYKFSKDWIINLGVIEKLKAEKSSAELAFLKSQVDPHFLFNTLNSLYATALEEGSTQTADGIAQLGTLMRYNLHDSQADFIPIQKEIDYVEKYIALQKLRITDLNEVNFTVDIPADSLQEVHIPPMLFIPFIENAFKYGVHPIEQSFITIAIQLKNNTLTLQTSNSIIQHTSVQESTGVGLQNVKNRLDLLYPAKHKLSHQAENDVFGVQLEIDITS